MKAWRLDRIGGPLTFEDVDPPELRRGAALVRLGAIPLLTYFQSYVAGDLPFFRGPDRAFTPGVNGVGTVEAVGPDVWHLKPGQRVIMSPHLMAQENVEDRRQILMGLTVVHPGSEPMQAEWPDGTLADHVLAPVTTLTPVGADCDHVDAVRLATLNRFIMPFGGMQRGRLAAGETLIVNGASGNYGTAGVVLGAAMGAARIVAAGRRRTALDRLVEIVGPRVRPVALTGDVEADAAAMREAAGGGAHMAFDMVGGEGSVGGASDPNSTIATLLALRHGGRLVLAGNVVPPLPIPYGVVSYRDLEILGQFMYPKHAYGRLLEMLGAGILATDAVTPLTFPLDALPDAMEAARKADSFECVVLVP